MGAFLRSALILAGQQGHTPEDMLMLLAYSAGLGIPFLISALLIDQLAISPPSSPASTTTSSLARCGTGRPCSHSSCARSPPSAR
ncbi:hypothetical protein [Collinsella tanakaei]|uniref:hypothetical protein n=1 Tax=Collinsella tanakaei TaxID=626935 RepID=UPI003AB5ECBD